jgi:hypothetical protein
MQTSKIDSTKNWTVDDYVLLGETDTPCELINGDLIMALHQTRIISACRRNCSDC